MELKLLKYIIFNFIILLGLSLSTCDLNNNTDSYNCGQKVRTTDVIQRIDLPEKPTSTIYAGIVTFSLTYRYNGICTQEMVNVSVNGKLEGPFDKAVSVEAHAEWAGIYSRDLQPVISSPGEVRSYSCSHSIDMSPSNPNDQSGAASLDVHVEYSFTSSGKYETDLEYLKSRFNELNITIDYYKHN